MTSESHRTATFLLSKDPSFESTGDLTMAKLTIALARESYGVHVICLSAQPASHADGHRRVLKPRISVPKLAVASLRRRHSLVHTRFDLDDLVTAIEEVVEESDSATVVADHMYMAESFLRSKVPAERLVVNTVVSESLVWAATRGVLGRFEARRILRDEVRVARQARSVGTYDAEEARFYQESGVARAHWLDLSLAPAPQIDLSGSGRRLVFFGDRQWPPNQEACELLLRWWPTISAGIEGAELCIVGTPGPRPIPPVAGVRDLGFVDDLPGFLSGCRALVAPIRTGGGVRVKVLDAARRGLPLVGTTTTLGSLTGVFDLTGYDDVESFSQRARQFLLDRQVAVAEGQRLYDVNAERWRDRLPHKAVEQWLA